MDTDTLVWVIFLFIWGVVSLVMKLARGAGSQAPPKPPRSAEEQERARKIQEEIRRRIAEAQQDGPPRKEQPPHQQRPQKPPRARPEPARAAAQPPPVVAQPEARQGHMRDYERELSRRMEHLREAREKKERALKTSRQKGLAAAKKEWHVPAAAAKGLREDIAAAFRDPPSARKAFLYSEIFGRPAAMRERSGHLPPL